MGFEYQCAVWRVVDVYVSRSRTHVSHLAQLTINTLLADATIHLRSCYMPNITPSPIVNPVRHVDHVGSRSDSFTRRPHRPRR